MFLAAICFVSCHGGSADHLAAFCEKLENVRVFAAGPAVQKFQDRGITVEAFEIEEGAENQIAKECGDCEVVVTDVGSAFDVKMQNALSQYAANARRYAYYDNPEPYVPGGYSVVAAEVMLAAQGVLFANSNLADETLYSEPGKPIDLGNRKKYGIGYYPLAHAEKIAKRRDLERDSSRQRLFKKHSIEDKGQKVLVYFGGNNDEYFNKAFPACLTLLEGVDLDKVLIVLQQHPAAKAKNIDGQLALAWKNRGKVIISDVSSDEAQVFADLALYYQTSMGPQFVLARIPTIQVGHEVYNDILVRNQLCPAATTVSQLNSALENMALPASTGIILEGLGIKESWQEVLKDALCTH